MRSLRPLLPARVALLLLLAAPFSPAARPVAMADDEAEVRATREYAVALGFERRKLYPQAAERWTKFVAEHPGHERIAHAHFHLGVCLFRGEKLAEAAAAFRHVLEKHPKFEHADEARFNLGLVLYNVAVESARPEDFAAAAAEFARVPADGDQAPDARYYEAECAYAAGKPDEAIAAYRRFAEKHAEAAIAPDAFYALGTIEQEQSRHEEAAKTFDRFLEKFAEHTLAPECRLRLAESRLHLRQFGPADKVLEELAKVENFPHADYVLLQQARSRFEQEDFAKSAELYESLPGRFPQSAYASAALVSAGRSRYEAGQFPQAEAVLQRAVVAKDALPAEAAYWLARTQIRLEKPADAVKTVDAVLPQTTDAEIRASLEFTRIEALAAQPAEEPKTPQLYAEFHGRHAKHELGPQALYRAALGALRQADHAAARTHADAFLKEEGYAQHALVPDVLLLAGESRLLPEQADFAAAETFYRRLVDEHEGHSLVSRAQVRIGACLLGAGKHEEAIKHLDAARGMLKEKDLRAEADLLAGRAHAAADRPKEAVQSLRRAWQEAEDWARGDEVLYDLAVNLRAADDPDAAATEFTRLVDRFKASPLRDRALYDLGDLFADRGKQDEAIGRFRQLIAEHGSSPLVPASHYGLAAAAYAKQDFAATVAELDKLLAAHAESSVAGDARWLRGLSRQQLDRHGEAVADFAAYLQTNPPADRAAEVRFALATSQIAQQQHEPAIATLGELLQQKPDWDRADEARYQLALAHLDAKQPDRAAAVFRELGEKHPKSALAAESWFRLGEYHEQANQPDEAAKAYTAGLEHAERPALVERLLYKLGWVRFAQEEYDESATAFKKLVEGHAEGELAGDAAFLLGESLYHQQKYAEALPWFDRVAKAKHPTFHARALYRAGDCAAATGKWPESQAYYASLLADFPKFEQVHEARYGFGLALQRQNRLDEARAAYLQVTKETDTETAAKARFMMGECAFAQKDHETAVEDFLEAALGYGHPEWQALGHLEAGRCFIELGDVEKAREALTVVVEDHPEHPRAKDARALLDKLAGQTGDPIP